MRSTLLSLTSFLFEAATLVIGLGLIFGLVAGWALTVYKCCGAAFGVGFALVAQAGERLAETFADLVRTRVLCTKPTYRELEERIEALQGNLNDARHKSTVLMKRVEDLRTQVRRAGSPKQAGVYAEVGLRPDSPDFLVQAARQAFRKEYHPDVCRSMPPDEAKKTFQAVENTFDQIWGLRGFR